MPSEMTLPDRWIVLKFGGTSVSRRERWDTIGRLARERADSVATRVLVVVNGRPAFEGGEAVGRAGQLLRRGG